MNDLETILDEWEKMCDAQDCPACHHKFTALAGMYFPRAIKALRYLIEIQGYKIDQSKVVADILLEDREPPHEKT